jgi:hypothetical protein
VQPRDHPQHERLGPQQQPCKPRAPIQPLATLPSNPTVAITSSQHPDHSRCFPWLHNVLRNRNTPPNTTTAARPANAHASAARGRHAVEGRSRIRIVAPRSGTALVTQILLLYFEKFKIPHPTRWRHAATGVKYNFSS